MSRVAGSFLGGLISVTLVITILRAFAAIERITPVISSLFTADGLYVEIIVFVSIVVAGFVLGATTLAYLISPGWKWSGLLSCFGVAITAFMLSVSAAFIAITVVTDVVWAIILYFATLLLITAVLVTTLARRSLRVPIGE